MRTNPNQTDSIKISNTKEENFEDFTFFESFVRISTGTSEDIRTRKRKTQKAFAMVGPVCRADSKNKNLTQKI